MITIYGIRCKENGKVYVGSTKNLITRLRQHISDLEHQYKSFSDFRKNYNEADFQEDYNKYGLDGFDVFVFEKDIPEIPISYRQFAEAFYINALGTSEIGKGYNKKNELQKRENVLSRGRRTAELTDYVSKRHRRNEV